MMTVVVVADPATVFAGIGIILVAPLAVLLLLPPVIDVIVAEESGVWAKGLLLLVTGDETACPNSCAAVTRDDECSPTAMVVVFCDGEFKSSDNRDLGPNNRDAT